MTTFVRDRFACTDEEVLRAERNRYVCDPARAAKVCDSLQARLELSDAELKKVVLRLPQVLSLSFEANIELKLAFILTKFHLTPDELRECVVANSVLLSYSLEQRYQPRVALASSLGVVGSRETLFPTGKYTDEQFMAWLRRQERVGLPDVEWAALCALTLPERADSLKTVAKPGADERDLQALRLLPLSEKDGAALAKSPLHYTDRGAEAASLLPEDEAEGRTAAEVGGWDKACAAEAIPTLPESETEAATAAGLDWGDGKERTAQAIEPIPERKDGGDTTTKQGGGDTTCEAEVLSTLPESETEAATAAGINWGDEKERTAQAIQPIPERTDGATPPPYPTGATKKTAGPTT